MSHFTLIVELPAGTPPAEYEDKVAELMAPYDEDREVPEYRSYWDRGTPQEHWSFEYVLESSERLSAVDTVTWSDFVDAYNLHYKGDGGRAVLYDAERDCPYEMTTYNPDSKWDWWCVGGRWRGYFTMMTKMSSDDAQRLIISGIDWMNEGHEVRQHACDGGPIRLLDLVGQRLRVEREANEYADKYERAILGTPEAVTWGEALEMFDNVDEARTFYHEQPRVAATRDLNGFFGNPISDFQWGREQYVRRAVLSAVPGYAYLTQDGEWLAPGEMGWFGMSSDTLQSRETYDQLINGRIASVDPDTVLIIIDCHI
jgi:hypothetical protein